MRSHEELEGIFKEWCYETLGAWLHEYGAWDTNITNHKITDAEWEYITDTACLDIDNLRLLEEE